MPELRAPVQDIAVIGIACRFPGAAGPRAFWKNLSEGRNHITEIPSDRWPLEDFYSPNHDALNRSVSKWGGFLEHADHFDHRFFNISPREARNMDPQQRLLLEEVWRCVEDSGVPLKTLRKGVTAVYVGCMQLDYTQAMADPAVERDGYACSGNFSCILSNRVSYLLGFRGPSMTLDTACSASLVAMHEARLALQNDLCDYAIVAGVSLNLSPWKYCSFSKARMLSPDGQCRTFDKDANGYVPGEGVAAILLQRADVARREGAHVYGLLKGSAVNHGGEALSLTAPTVAAQKEVILHAWQNAGLSLSTCGCVEAHGTGTSLGDPIEIEALTQAFREHTEKKQFCRIGSVKTNIGHLEPAAGLAGVIKVLLMMQHGQIAPTLNLQNPNPLIAFEQTPFVLARHLEPWEPNGGIYRAGVSSFGFGGVNSHVVLEYRPEAQQSGTETRPELFVLSAKNRASLERMKKDWRAFLDSPDRTNLSWSNLCATIQTGREQFQHRFAAIASSVDELRKILEEPEENHPPAIARCALTIGTGLEETAASHPLARTEAFQQAWRECEHALGSISPNTGNAEFATGYSIARALQNILPEFSFITAEGSGTWAGLAISGILTVEDAAGLAAGTQKPAIQMLRPVINWYDPAHGQWIRTWRIVPGYLATLVRELSFSPESLRSLRHHATALFEVQFTFKKNLESWSSHLASFGLDPRALLDLESNGYSRLSAVIVADSLRKLNRKWHLSTTLALPEFQESELLDLLDDGVIQQPEFIDLFLSGSDAALPIATAAQVRTDRIDRSRPYRLLRSLNRTIEELEDHDQWLHDLRSAAGIRPPKDAFVLGVGKSRHATLSIDSKGELPFLAALKNLWIRGIDIDWKALRKNEPRRIFSLPTYQFEGQRFWIQKNSKSAHVLKEEQRAPSAEIRSPGNVTEGKPLQKDFDSTTDWIVRDHLIAGRPILPAAAMVDLILKAAGVASPVTVTNLRIDEPAPAEPLLKIAISTGEKGAYHLRANGKLVCTAAVSRVSPAQPGPFAPEPASFQSSANGHELYSAFAAAGYQYGPGLRVIERHWRSGNAFWFELGAGTPDGEFECHPALLDGVLQAGLAAARLSGRIENRLFLPCECEAMHLHSPLHGRLFVLLRNENINVEKSALKISCEVISSAGKPVLSIQGLLCRAASKAFLRNSAPEQRSDTSKVEAGSLNPGPQAAQGSGPDSTMNRMAFDTEPLRAELAAKLSTILGVERTAVDTETDLREYGLDSVSLTEYAESLEAALAVQLDPTLLFEYPTLQLLAEYLVQTFPEQMSRRFGGTITEASQPPASEVPKEVAQTPRTPGALKEEHSRNRPAKVSEQLTRWPNTDPSYDVAIVGIAGRFPGAETLEEWWNALAAGQDLITEIPPDRWNWREYFGDPHAGANKTNCRWGGFVRDIDKFDASFFGISPKEAAMMDPQQRLLLEMTWHVVEDAGHNPTELAGSRTGVFIGVCNDDYRELIDRHTPQVEAQTSTGTYFSIVANRISYWFDFQGPSVAIDTACSSSLVALHQAMQALRDGDCELAIAGGVNICCTPRKYISFSKAGMLSEDGRCRTFDARAKGYVRGEGAGLVLLKPLRKALDDGNPIYGVIKGTAVNHGGSANSLTAPNPNAQASLIVTAWKRAGVTPDQISYIEAHGTGTELGDPIEIAGLKKAFRELGADSSSFRCGIGSVKTNVGHLESAAGIAGVIKVLLALKHRQLPGTVHFQELNPHIDLSNSPFYITASTQPWEATAPRRAGVSSFGFGGVNAHVALEESPGRTETPPGSEKQIIILSAKFEGQLKQMAASLLRWLGSPEAGKASLQDIAFTLQTGREAFVARFAAVAGSKSELHEKLERFVNGQSAEVWTGTAVKALVLEDAPEDRAFIQQLAASGKLERIARLWVSGAAIPWRALHKDIHCRRISLPGYAFVRDRHWIADHPATTTVKAAAPRIHALLRRNDLPGSEPHFDCDLEAADPLVRDHVVTGQAILPGVVYLELARAAGQSSEALPVTRISDAIWLRPLVVNEGRLTTRIRVNAEGEYTIHSFAGGTEHLHGTGKLHRDPQGPHSKTDLERLKKLPRTASGTEVYGTFDANGVAYGGFYKGLVEVRHSDTELVGRISLSTDPAPVSDWVLPPPILDSAVQITLWWLIQQQGANAKLFLPFSAREVRIFGSIPRNCFVHASAEEVDLDAGFARFHLTICDEGGNAVLEIIDFCIRRYLPNENQISADVEEPAEPIYFRPVWRSVPPSPAEPHESLRTLIFTHAGDSGLGSRIAAALPGSSTTLVFLGREFRQAGERCFSIDATSLEDYRRIIQRAGELDRVYFVGAFPSATISSPVQEPIHWIFRLIKALQLSGKERMDFRVLTSDAFAVEAESTVNATAAAIAAFAQVAAHEVSGWRVSILDLSCAECLDLQVENLPALSPLVAIRGGQWFKRVLQPLRFEGETHIELPLASGAVCVVAGGASGLGFETARVLSSEKKAKIALIGRRARTPEIEQKLVDLATLGGEAEYFEGDITDRAAMERIRNEIRARFGPVRAVFHSALVLMDSTIASMNDRTLGEVLAPKIEGTLVLQDVFGIEPLDLFVAFSSANSFLANAGQSNYVAACAFQDAAMIAFAHRSRARVRVINWGYWAETGIVAGSGYREQLAAAGIFGFSTRDGVRALRQILSGPCEQVMAARFSAPVLESMAADRNARARVLGRKRPCVDTLGTIVGDEPVLPGLDMDRLFSELATYGKLRLLSCCREQNLVHDFARLNQIRPADFKAIARHERLAAALCELLRDAALETSINPTREEIDRLRTRIMDSWPDSRAYLALMDACVPPLPDILRGRVSPLEVVFPNGSADLVAPIYSGNAVSDFFNRIVSQGLAQAVSLQARAHREQTIRILEIGAGVGGTTVSVLEELSRTGARIEYWFTDISPALLKTAAEKLGAGRNWLRFHALDIEKDIKGQGFEAGSMDFAIATNVLHATSDILKSLARVKSLLAPNGLLFLNEVTAPQPYLTLSFGLLDGWWRATDLHRRILHSPLLSPEGWLKCLTEAGFGSRRIFGNRAADQAVQTVFVAESDGIIEEAASVHNVKQPGLRAPGPAVHIAEPNTTTNTGAETPIEEIITEIVASATGQPRDNISGGARFVEMGVDSIIGIGIINRLNKALELNLKTTTLFNYTSVADLAAHIRAKHKPQIPTTAHNGSPQAPVKPIAKPAVPSPTATGHAASVQAERRELPSQENPNARLVAVIGMSGRFPGARNVQEFWNNLAHGVDSIREVPVDRWGPHERFFSPDKTARDRAYIKVGGFLDEIECFDPLFFDLSPREAELMDPQQRLFLEECWKAIEDAGYSNQAMAHRKCGVFAGVSKGDYFEKMHEAGLPLNSHTWIGNETSILSARIAYHLNLKGPAFPIDTACSSSLVALHLACRGILAGECDMALAGGVFILTTPSFYIHTSKTLMLSPDGKCKAFDEDANGFVPGEGAAVVLLKRLDQALADGDQIYGVIRGSGVNQDGKTNGITAPNLLSQKSLLEEVYRDSGVDPDTISYVETHGTGTKLGDPIEIDALTEAFSGWTSRKQFCAIGSVKTNIGHTATAAGVAGLIKILLSFQHRQIPPSLHFEKPNGQIDFASTPFFVNTRLREWTNPSEAPRRAALSSFGFSGTNAHIVLEEPPAMKRREASSGPCLFCISAKTKEALELRIRDLLNFLSTAESSIDPVDLSFTLNAGRSHFGWRVAVVANHLQDLRAALQSSALKFPAASVKPSPELNASAATLVSELNQSAGSSVRDRAKLYHSLADLYSQGADIDWKLLFQLTGQKRISLPLYPFAKLRCWPFDDALLNSDANANPEPKALRREKIFLRREWAAAPQLAAEATLPPGTWLVVCDRSDSATLRSVLPAGPDVKLLLVCDSSAQRKVSAAEWEFSFESIDQSEWVSGELARAGEITGVLHVLSEGGSDSTAPGLIRLYQLLLERSLARGMRLLFVTRGVHSIENTAPSLRGATWAGLIRALGAEYGALRATHLDLDPTLPRGRQTDALAAEFRANEGGAEICYRRGRRLRSHLALTDIPVSTGRLQLDPGKVYVVTGATGGLGFEVSKFLISRGARKLAVLSRSSAQSSENVRKRERLEALEALGAQLYSGHPSLENEDDLTGFFSELRHRAGLIGGVVHCAGTIGESGTPFVRKSMESVASVLAPKVVGTQLLARVVQHDPLDFFVLFSSIAGLIPQLATGAADYGAANSFLDTFAEYASQKYQRPFISINWPSWKETGIGEVKSAKYTGAGFHSITTAEGIEFLESILTVRPGPVIAPCVIDPTLFSLASLASDEKPETKFAIETVRQRSLTESSDPALASLISFFARELKIPKAQLDAAATFSELGIDSVLVADLVRKLEPMLGAPLDPSAMLEYPSIQQLGVYLRGKYPGAFHSSAFAHTAPAAGKVVEILNCPTHPAGDEAIAIIGIGCRFPGAEGPSEFWKLLREGGSAIREVPPERWSANRWYSPTGEKGKSIGKWGGFIEGMDRFDAAWFGISDEDAEQMDPLARLFLETSVQTLRDAGYDKESLWNSRTGVFAGARISGFAEYLETYCRSTIAGIGQNFIAAQVAQFHHFRGPNLVIDTACSSSLASVHYACQSLRSGECAQALAGGVDLLLNEKIYLMLTEAKALSPSGKCQTFDAKADGYVPGEGAGLVLLKPLSAALAAGDRIYAVIRSSAVNNDGHTMGITTPSLEAQEQLIREALRKAGLTAEAISYIEAHGTGTMIGDPIELKALTKAFRHETSLRQFCPVGSVKTNIGHLHSAAGIASVIKVALALQARELPPTLNCETPNPRFEFADSPFYPLTSFRPWNFQSGPRHAGISSFGFGGTNCHMILGERPEHQPKRQALSPARFNRKRFWPGTKSESNLDRISERARPRPLLVLTEDPRP